MKINPSYEEIIKNWSVVGDEETVDDETCFVIEALRSRTTGEYLVEDDNPELFRKIIGVLLGDEFMDNVKEENNEH